ncbi:hypothetical protein U1839_09785 [Sphingomonas sp. RT2P30]|uniref:hypothetical protein n=1 Tax=Parasphingomonas halimpatiens TaxID=3096162 RepID=UPI002FCC7066
MTDTERLMISAGSNKNLNAAPRPRTLVDFVAQKAQKIGRASRAKGRELERFATARANRATRRLGKRALAHRPHRVIFAV